MSTEARIGLVGDHDEGVPAHRAIPAVLAAAAVARGREVTFDWIPTAEVRTAGRMLGYQGVWCVPGSPYRSMAGALRAIRWARENGVPFLGTCGGFQHALVEYARHVLGWSDADHEETSPNSTRLVVSLLDCPLVEATERVRFLPGTKIAAAYGVAEASEGYRCRYGLNPAVRPALLGRALRIAALDEGGGVRAVELEGHPFFVATLFQPERAALHGERAPLVEAFVEACAASARGLA